jgi:hypothetical protein
MAVGGGGSGDEPNGGRRADGQQQLHELARRRRPKRGPQREAARLAGLIRCADSTGKRLFAERAACRRPQTRAKTGARRQLLVSVETTTRFVLASRISR